MANPHVGDQGTIFRLEVRDQNHQILDISTATDLKIRFEKPDGSTFSKAGVFTTDGTDGQFQCSSQSTDLDLAGDWSVQGEITMPTWAGATGILEFTVDPNIEVSP